MGFPTSFRKFSPAIWGGLFLLLGFALNTGCSLRINGIQNSLEVLGPPQAPLGLGYGRSWITLMRGRSMTPLFPMTSAGSGLTYSVTPSFPTGLSIDPFTGVIYGTPSININPGLDYTITAKNVAGVSSAVLNVRILDGFIVNSTLDEGDAANDGLCLSTPSGMCTLRAAIQQINSDFIPRVIIVPNGTYNVGSVLSASSALAIVGQSAGGTIISGQNLTRILEVLSGQSYDLSDVTVRDANNSGGLFEGGAIHVSQPNTQLRVSNSQFINNTVSAGKGGGAIAVGDWGNPGINLYAEYSGFIGNSATSWHGGGIEGANANVIDLKYVQFFQNSSGQEGGGLFGSANLVSAYGVTFSGNSAGIGGGVEFGSTGSASLINCTFTGNQATGGGGSGLGGAIAQLGAATVTIVNSTITGNSTPNPLGLGSGGIGYNGTGPILLLNTIVAGNTAANGNNNCNLGTFVSNGSNISDNSECAIGTGSGDQAGVSLSALALGPLGNYGGPVQTIALGATSIAIDMGHNAGCPATDARGFPRPVKKFTAAACDVGAFELQ